MNALSQATSPDTAVLIQDYPYGFRLRCSIRYWIEHKKNHGFRIINQTTNPKLPGTVWNTPKAGTYHAIAAALRIDPETGYVVFGGVGEYSDLADLESFRENYPDMPALARESLGYYIAMKTAYEDAVKAQGLDNYFNGTPEQRSTINRATVAAGLAHGRPQP